MAEITVNYNPNSVAQTPLVTGVSTGIDKYRSPFSCVICVFWFIFVAVGIFVESIIITQNDDMGVGYIFFGLIFIFFPTLVMGCFPLYSTITVDKFQGIITFRKYSVNICCWKKTVVCINDIKDIYSQLNTSVSYTINHVHYNGFDIVIELKNGNKILPVNGDIDKGTTKEDILRFLSRNLPGLVRYVDGASMNIGLQTITPIYAPTNPVMPTPQYYQGPPQPIYAQPQMSYQPQYPVAQPQYPVTDMSVSSAVTAPQYPGQNDVNNQMVPKPGENNAAPMA